MKKFKIKDIIYLLLFALTIPIWGFFNNDKKKINLTLEDIIPIAHADHPGGAGSQGFDSGCGNSGGGGEGGGPGGGSCY